MPLVALSVIDSGFRRFPQARAPHTHTHTHTQAMARLMDAASPTAWAQTKAEPSKQSETEKVNKPQGRRQRLISQQMDDKVGQLVGRSVGRSVDRLAVSAVSVD